MLMNQLIKYFAKNNFYTDWKINSINDISNLNSDQLLTKYNERFIFLFQKAYNKSPFYKELYQKHGIQLNDINDLNDIKKLPVVNRDMIKDRVEDIYNSFNFLKIIGLTSGTSGSPLTLFRTIFDISTEQAYIRHYRNSHGFSFGQPLLSIRGALGKNIPFENFKKANTLYISSPNINENTIEMYYSMIVKFKPRAIEAFPSYIFKLCFELQKKGLELKVPIVFTSSETLYGFQREFVESYLGATIYDWYGNAERSILLAQNNDLIYKPLPLYSINEFEKDHIITTNLINTSFPLIRYEVHDIVTLNSQGLINDNLNPDIISIEGRASENLLLKDGSVVGCIDHAFKGVKNLEIAQVHQYNVTDPLNIKIVVTASFSKTDEEQLKTNFIRMVGVETELKFTYCKREDLTFTKNKKYRLIIKNP